MSFDSKSSEALNNLMKLSFEAFEYPLIIFNIILNQFQINN